MIRYASYSFSTFWNYYDQRSNFNKKQMTLRNITMMVVYLYDVSTGVHVIVYHCALFIVTFTKYNCHLPSTQQTLRIYSSL